MGRSDECVADSFIVRHRLGQSGFTLLELGVVITLLALFSFLTIPLFGGSGGISKLGYSARCLNGTIKYLFNEAALTGREYRLIYNLDRGTYSAQVLEADGEVVTLSGIGRETKLAGDVRFRDLQLPGRGTFTTGEVTVRIHSAGWVEEASVHLEDGSGNALTLHVMPLTGTAEIFEGYKTL
ncbi:MAG: type II secretion system protein [Desulfurivibrio sp.]|nr:type II secretion system protein [Desulfurivibrio sp.]